MVNDYLLAERIDRMESSQNRWHRSALNFLDIIMDSIGYDEPFSLNDFQCGKKHKGYGPKTIERLIELGYIEKEENGKFIVTYEGMRASELREDSREIQDEDL